MEFGRQSSSIKRLDTGTKGGIEDIFTHFRVLWWRTPWNGKILILVLLLHLQHKRSIAATKNWWDVRVKAGLKGADVWRALRSVHLCVSAKLWWNIWLHTRHKEGKGLGGRRRNCWFEGSGVCCTNSTPSTDSRVLHQRAEALLGSIKQIILKFGQMLPSSNICRVINAISGVILASVTTRALSKGKTRVGWH